MKRSVQFPDLIYENIVFSNSLPSRVDYLSRPSSFDPTQLIQSPEFARLSFIRRHGLAWIVYPAASQSQLEYTIGTWGLARLAESLIKVEISNTRVKPLLLWMEEAKIRPEFYLTLLCKLVGCAPLAAALEVNPRLRAGLAGANIETAEKRAAALISDSGLKDVWRSIAKERYGSAGTIGSKLKPTDPFNEQVCIPLVCYLLTGDRESLGACFHPHKHQAGFVRDLIGGLFFLRRLDRYGRDSYISTIRQFGKNLRGFLSNLVLSPSRKGDSIEATAINSLAIDHAIGLLLKRRNRLFSRDLSTDVVALHEMVNWGFSAHSSTLSDHDWPDFCKQIVFMEDDQVLELLSASQHRACHSIVQRIRAAEPYFLVGKWFEAEHIDPVVEIINSQYGGMVRDSATPPELLTRYVAGDVTQEANCFAISNIRVGCQGEPLAKQPRYRNNVAYLQNLAGHGCLYVFAREREQSRFFRKEVNALLKH